MTPEQAETIQSLCDEYGSEPVYAALGELMAPKVGGLDFRRWVRRLRDRGIA